MKKLILLFAILTISSQNILAQIPDYEWAFTSPGPVYETWAAPPSVAQIQETVDGGFILTITFSDDGRNSSTVIKINKYGKLEWKITLYEWWIDYILFNYTFQLVALTADNGYVIDGPVVINDILIEESGRFKLNSAGEVEYPYIPEPTLPWQNYLDTGLFDSFIEDNSEMCYSLQKVLKTSDGGYILAYDIYYKGIHGGFWEYWLLKISGPAKSYSISGNVEDSNGIGISGASVTFSNGGATVSTNTDGYYLTSVSNGWSGESSASKNGYTFSPTNYTYNSVATDQTNQDFIGTALPSSYFIAGHIRDTNGMGIENVAVEFSNGGATVYTNSTGHYSTSVSSGWNGTSTPTLADWTFRPSYLEYPAISEDKFTEDYLGTNILLAIEYDLSVLPSSFTVLPAYPNPFNPSTTIRYGIPENVQINGKTTIEIYDITGKLVNTLLNQDQSSGWHSVQWNGTNQYNKHVPAGLYLSRITFGNQVKSIKLMLLK